MLWKLEMAAAVVGRGVKQLELDCPVGPSRIIIRKISQWLNKSKAYGAAIKLDCCRGQNSVILLEGTQVPEVIYKRKFPAFSYRNYHSGPKLYGSSPSFSSATIQFRLYSTVVANANKKLALNMETSALVTEAPTPKARSFKSNEEFANFFENIDAVMFDCDGVLWLGPTIIPKAPDVVKKLRALGRKVFFMTNNSTRTREEFQEKFNSLGFEASLDEIVSTSYLAALYLKEMGFSKKAYVIGTSGITKELNAVGISTLPIGPDVIPKEMLTWNVSHLENIPLDPEVGAVVVGFDHHFSYAKLFKAASYLNNPDCIFVGTNTDESFPSANKMITPGTGSLVVSVKTASGREPVVMGKPSRIPFDYVQRHHNLQPSRVLMVGDRGNTDILFGKTCGLHTLMVFTGVNSFEDVLKWETSPVEEERACVPEYCLKDVAAFYDLIQALP